VTRITEGTGREDDIELLENLGTVVQSASMCGLGQSAANPVLSTLKYFRDEYDAHILEHRCPAHVCKALIAYDIDPELCKGCMLCARACPAQAIIGKPKEPHRIDQKKCIKCGICITICPPKIKAIRTVSPVSER
jgi:ferredoxin